MILSPTALRRRWLSQRHRRRHDLAKMTLPGAR
jgi:hypothetical protein